MIRDAVSMIFMGAILIGSLVMTIINLIKIYKQMKCFVLSERLPWILYLVSCYAMIITIVFATFASSINDFIGTYFLYAVYSLVPLLITTGFLIEAFKPTWRKGKIAWWIYISFIVFVIGYSLLTYRLDHNGVFGDDLDTMLFLAGAFVLPALASLLAMVKASDKINKSIYGSFTVGYFSIVFTAIITICTRGDAAPLLFLCLGLFFVLVWHGTSMKLKQLVVSSQENIQQTTSGNDNNQQNGENGIGQ